MIYTLKDITKHYRARTGPVASLNGVSFTVAPGERVALLGPSGAGKTTLFRLLNATLRATSGNLSFEGREVGRMSGHELRAMRQRIGTIYQQPHLVPSLSVLENTLCGCLGRWSLWQTLRTWLRPASAEVKQARRALEMVGLADKYRVRADELSGGQQQRLTLARVLMQQPDVILADEPFASLDPSLTESIAALLIGLVEEGPRTLVATLHDVELALRYFPRIVALREGQVAFDLAASQVTPELLAALYTSESVPKEVAPPSRSQAPSATQCEPTCVR